MSGSSRRGGERDQPRNIPVAGEVLRREVLRLGFSQGASLIYSGNVNEFLAGDGSWQVISSTGGGGNLQWAGSWGGTIPDGIFLSQYQGAWS